MPAPKNPVNAVRTCFRVLESVQRKGSAGVTEVAADVGVTKGTVHNHLSTLEDEEYVVKTDDDTYKVGLRFLTLAHSARNRIRVFDLVREEVDGLAEESGEMALFTVEEHGLGVCVYRALSETAVRTPLYVGHRSELHHTAVGKAILAHLSRARVEAIVDRRGLADRTDRTITDVDALFDELAEIREAGFAFNREETITGLVGVGKPIFDPTGSVIGAISVIGPRSRLDDERFYEAVPDLLTRSVNIVQVNATSL